MTWHMVEQYGLPSPVECMREVLGDASVNLCALPEDHELSDAQKTDRAIGCLTRVMALTYLLRLGWSRTAYRDFRNPLLEHVNDFDRVRAARVIETTLGEEAPADWDLGRALSQTTAWLDVALPEMQSELNAPTAEELATALSILANHCLESRSWLSANGTNPSGPRLAKLLRQGRRLLAILELFSHGLSEEWNSLRPVMIAWVDCLERWTQVSELCERFSAVVRKRPGRDYNARIAAWLRRRWRQRLRYNRFRELSW